MGVLGRDILRKKVEVRRPKSLYKGEVVGYMYKTKHYQIKITEAVKGTIKPGRVITAKTEEVYEI